jgi:predicted  nucleic acid-binding Zn-ribbon protein
MLPIVEQLLILQDRDRKLLRLKAELADTPPQRKRLQDKAANAQAAFEAVKQQSRHIESERKKLELEVSSKEEFIRKIETQQGATKSNDQYKAFTHQIETTKAEIHALEDKEIALMEQAEMAAKALAAAAKVAADHKAETDKQLADLAAREANLKKEFEAASAERAGLAEKVDSPTLARYQHLLDRKGDNVVVGVKGAICGGCHMKLPQQTVVTARAQSEIVTCINCSRLLYWTRDMD